MTPSHEIEAVLLQIRTVALELRTLEGDGLDSVALTPQRRQLEGLKARLAELVSRDPGLVAACRRQRLRDASSLPVLAADSRRAPLSGALRPFRA